MHFRVSRDMFSWKTLQIDAASSSFPLRVHSEGRRAVGPPFRPFPKGPKTVFLKTLQIDAAWSIYSLWVHVEARWAVGQPFRPFPKGPKNVFPEKRLDRRSVVDLLPSGS